MDFTFIRAPVKRIADVLSKGFPSGEHVYDLTPRWRVADCSRGVPFAHINGARREFPPAVEAHALHGACDAFEFYINVAPSDSGMKSYVQLASFWRGNGGAGLDVNIMPDTCFEAFVFLEGEEAAVLAGYAHGMERPELARAVCGTVRGAGLRKGASAQAVQDAWHR